MQCYSAMKESEQPTMPPCSVVMERLTQDYIEKAIKSVKFASEKKKPKRIVSKRKRKTFENKKHTKKWKCSTSDSESDFDDETDPEDTNFQTSACIGGTNRVLRSNSSFFEPEFEHVPKNVIFSCKKCAFVTNTEEHLLLHKSVHKNVCFICKLSFATNAECDSHIALNHTPTVEKVIIFGCKNCKQHFTNESEYKNHLLSHVETASDQSEKFSCSFCRTQFAKHTSLINHVLRSHVTYKCTFCDTLAPKFDILERHCQTSHSYYGRPFECDYCDFKFAVFGCLQMHRNEYHAILSEEGEDKCRFCNFILVDKGSLLQHFAKHVQVSLFKCYMCEYCTNSAEEMTEHSRFDHSKPEIFATKIEEKELMEMVKELIKVTFNQQLEPEIKQTRQKPTTVETIEAIATILDQSETTEVLDNIESDTFITVPVETETKKISSICTVAKASHEVKNKNLRRSKRNKQPEKVNEEQSEENGIAINQYEEETDIETSDQENDCDQRAIMSVDPTTNRLYVNGVPVFDESGNEVFVVRQFVDNQSTS